MMGSNMITRDKALAMQAAAYEAAAESVSRHSETARKKMREARDLGADRSLIQGWSSVIAHLDCEEGAIRALATADQRAALDRLIADKVAEATGPLVAALHFYATGSTFAAKLDYGADFNVAPILQDKGKLARTTIAALKGGA